MNPTFLVTGATGFLGSHFIHKLLNKEYNVIGIKRRSSDLWRLNDVINSDKLRFYNVEDLSIAFKESKIDCVIHTVCSYGRNGENLEEIVKTNILFGLEIFELVKSFNVNCFFNTDTLLPRNLNNYSLSKKQFVEWLQKNYGNVQVFNMKVEHMYGPQDDSSKFVTWLIQQLKENVAEIELTSGIQKRDFIYVDDVVNAYLTVYMNREKFGKYTEFDVGTGNQVSVKDFISEIYKLEKNINPKLTTILKFGAKEYRKGEQMEVLENIKPLKDLGWQPQNTDYTVYLKEMMEE